MELKCLGIYSSLNINLTAGDTTVDKDISEEKKAQMLADFPGKFEVYEGSEVTTPVAVELAVTPTAVEGGFVDVAAIVTAAQKPGKKGK